MGDTYYLYFSISSWGTQNSRIALATSTTMHPGDWQDLGSTGVESRDGDAYNAIDGNLLQDRSGNYLTFGSFWGGLYQVPMSSPPTTASGTPYNVELNDTGSRPSEGPYLFNYGSWYYLFWSSGQCCKYDTERPAQGEEYKIMVCRSDSPTGPFVRLIHVYVVLVADHFAFRRISTRSLALKTAERRCSPLMTTSTDLVDRVSIMTRRTGRSFTTTMLTLPLVSLMVRNYLESISWTFQAGGRYW